MFKKSSPAALALFSGILLSLAWFKFMTCLIFVAWVPLLLLEERFASDPGMKRRKLKLTGLSYLTFFTWNLCVTWWVAYASLGGAAMAILCNSLLMSMVFMIYHNTRCRIHKAWGMWLLIPVWLAWEYGHTLWDLSWTWLTLGNVFAFQHNWVQWYSFTGTSGGSLWILTVNILLAKLLLSEKFQVKRFIAPVTVIALPIVLSLIMRVSVHTDITTPPAGKNIVVVQPNVDPYNEKFYLDPAIQLSHLLTLVQGKVTDYTDYLVLPETFLTENIWEDQLEDAFSVRFLKDSIIRHFPKLKIITGASTLKRYLPGEAVSATARKFDDADMYYDAYNTALQIDASGATQIYHKSKLVPGVERMPFPALLKPLEELAINMGGTSGSLGTQSDRTVFFDPGKHTGIAPVICYESIYGDYITEYIRKGANLIFIITNDGWWDDTPGHTQHLAYGALRAIETGCPIARSANTGISCFINELGDISQATPWWQPAVIESNLVPNNQPTFFVRYGDLISLAAVAIALLAIVFGQFLRFRKA